VGVVDVTHETFEKEVLESKAPWLVAFVDGDTDAEWLQGWTAAAKGMKNMVPSQNGFVTSFRP
jgi:hypothetical protein